MNKLAIWGSFTIVKFKNPKTINLQKLQEAEPSVEVRNFTPFQLSLSLARTMQMVAQI